jgi:hypothetical protein
MEKFKSLANTGCIFTRLLGSPFIKTKVSKMSWKGIENRIKDWLYDFAGSVYPKQIETPWRHSPK